MRLKKKELLIQLIILLLFVKFKVSHSHSRVLIIK